MKMAHLQLHPDVSFGLVDGQRIFLDVVRDRYFALGAEANAALDRARMAGPASLEQPDIARLLGTGLFSMGPAARPLIAAHIDVPGLGLQAQITSDRPRPFDVIEITWLLARMRRGLEARAIKSILARLAHRRHAIAAPAGPDRTARLASRFLKSRALAPIAPVCLQDSLALGFWLARRSACPNIVFGARLEPFAAHCWVQTDSAILNDAPDRVSQFAPVLVL